MKTEFERIKKKVHDTSIHISDCNKVVKTKFKELAKLEFKDDYGITLKFLLACADGLFSRPNEQLQQRIDIIAEEVSNLNKIYEVKSKEPEIVVKTLSGRRIGVMNKEE